MIYISFIAALIVFHCLWKLEDRGICAETSRCMRRSNYPVQAWSLTESSLLQPVNRARFSHLVQLRTLSRINLGKPVSCEKNFFDTDPMITYSKVKTE